MQPWMHTWFSELPEPMAGSHPIFHPPVPKGHYQDHPVPNPVIRPPLDQMAQSLIQSGPSFEHFQGCGSHSFSEQCVPVPQHPHIKEFLPDI